MVLMLTPKCLAASVLLTRVTTTHLALHCSGASDFSDPDAGGAPCGDSQFQRVPVAWASSSIGLWFRPPIGCPVPARTIAKSKSSSVEPAMVFMWRKAQGLARRGMDIRAGNLMSTCHRGARGACGRQWRRDWGPSGAELIAAVRSCDPVRTAAIRTGEHGNRIGRLVGDPDRCRPRGSGGNPRSAAAMSGATAAMVPWW